MRRDYGKAYEIIRNALVEARLRAGLSQREVAEALGVHQQWVSKVETGERRIDVVELVAMSDITGMDLESALRTLRRDLSRTS